MIKLGVLIFSFTKKFVFGWNMFWWNYHIERAREHDRRNECIEPGWRNIFSII